MEIQIDAAATIAAALLRDYPRPSTEKITELLVQAFDALEVATGLEHKRQSAKFAELKKGQIVKR